MNDQLHHILLDGEEIRWSGRPDPFKLMDLPARNSLIFTWIISGCTLGLTLGLFIASFVYTPFEPLDFSVLLLALLFLPLMIALRPILDRRCLIHDTIYAITNCRVIAMIKGDIMYLPLTQKLKTATASCYDGFGNLCFGEAVHVSARKELSAAVIGVRTIGDIANPNVPGIVFYHIRHPETLLRYLA